MASVLISGWKPGFKTVSATELLRNAGHGLATAKGLIERVLAGEPVHVEMASLAAAQQLVKRLDALGGIARVEPNGAAA